MQKKYAPVRVKNPASKHAMVRLLQGQQLNLVFDRPEYLESKIDISGSLLEVDDIEQTQKGWVAVISQKASVESDCSLFLGEVKLYDGSNKNNANICVLTAASKNDVVRIINPENCHFTMQPSQVLEVLIQSKDMHEMWHAYPSGQEMVLEQIQHVIRSGCSLGTCDMVIEHLFRFRFNHPSIQYLSGKPYAKYDGGTIHFDCATRRSTLSITCSWRDRSSIYKALMFPKIPSFRDFDRNRIRGKKHAQEAVVELKKLNCDSLEYGCNVLAAR
jgi:hypothetical protein